MAETHPVAPRPAAAIVLMRAGQDGQLEVFMVRRHMRSTFVPDVYVFPGGSVNPDDRETELTAGLCVPVGEGPTTLGSGFRAAAIRECFEEAGVLLARRAGGPLTPEDLTDVTEHRQALQERTTTLRAIAEQERLMLATDALIHWAHWITPQGFNKRFDTHFFLTEMPASQEAAHDEVETTASAWITPKEALVQFEQGTLPLAFAQVHQLRALAEVGSAEEARTRFNGLVPRTIMPRVVERDGVSMILLPDEE
ncbi:MAG TPA: NUDIX hydrolase [Ktedonobacterales bacterium]|nr:NUDIX hydrolase [Ktedonobacterales bacterium]